MFFNSVILHPSRVIGRTLASKTEDRSYGSSFSLIINDLSGWVKWLQLERNISTYPSAQCLPSVFYMLLLGTLLLALLVASLWPELCDLRQSHHRFYR